MNNQERQLFINYINNSSRTNLNISIDSNVGPCGDLVKGLYERSTRTTIPNGVFAANLLGINNGQLIPDMQTFLNTHSGDILAIFDGSDNLVHYCIRANLNSANVLSINGFTTSNFLPSNSNPFSSPFKNIIATNITANHFNECRFLYDGERECYLYKVY